jgi:hypothetical protein
MTVAGYWISNVLGFILMHYGYGEVRANKYSFKKNWKKYMFWTTLYTIIIALLIYYEVLPSGQEIIEMFNG